MTDAVNNFLDWISEFIAHRKGLLVILGILLVLTNFLLHLFPGVGWLAQSNLLLHLGIIFGFFGILLAWAL